jgi:uncharacterized protein
MDMGAAQPQAMTMVVTMIVIVTMVAMAMVVVVVIMVMSVGGALPVMIMMLAHRSPRLHARASSRPALVPCYGRGVRLANKARFCMTRATAVLTPGVPVTLAPAGGISFEVEEGQRLRLTQPEGEQVADFISFARDDVRELLSMHSSRAVNLSWKLTAPDVLYSNRTRPMWQIEDDLTAENYCGGGYCSEHLNVARYGAVGVGAPSCQSNLEAAVRGYGMDRWSFNVDTCFNVFMTVAYDADGKWEIRPPKGKPGDHMTLVALMPQIVAISNCPILFNSCNNFRLKPLTLEILK